MAAPVIDPVTTDETLPARADVVIIGGGIIGTSAALYLAQKGVSVVLCEKGHIAGEQSSRNWGWCRKMARDPREIPLVIESLRLWQGMNETVEAETGFRTCGIMYLAETAEHLALQESWLEHAREYQLDTRVINGAEVARLLPGSAKKWAGALYTASDGKAEPQKATPAIVAAARRLGATIVTGCAARGLETSGGRVSAVVTEKGRIACQSAVIAGGAWSRLFCGNLGIDLPQLKVLGSVMRTEKLDGGPEISASGGLFGYRKRLDGGYTVATLGVRTIDLVPDSFRLMPQYIPAVRLHWKKLRFRVGGKFAEELRMPRRWALDRESPFESMRVLDPAADPYVLDRARASIAEAFPAFKNIKIADSWGGMIDVMPDAIPVISAVDSVPGFFIATGFSGHGFGIGPGAGRLVADMVSGGSTIVDPTPFRLSRFTDGSNPRPHPLAS
ncbi:MAG TPA: FAD-binding oxidoreductase [Stellaceae bacterium]|jgi:glycine/D-amino acid oxidase-like deaminating enzyme|nr:FAD-binding oxidoreductase [Stellaceae bacterium]